VVYEEMIKKILRIEHTVQPKIKHKLYLLWRKNSWYGTLRSLTSHAYYIQLDDMWKSETKPMVSNNYSFPTVFEVWKWNSALEKVNPRFLCQKVYMKLWTGIPIYLTKVASVQFSTTNKKSLATK